MRATMHVSLPPTLKRWVDRQVGQGGYATASEYVRQLIREEQRRQARVHVESELAAGEQSGAPQPVTTASWDRSARRVATRLRSAQRGERRGADRRAT